MHHRHHHHHRTRYKWRYNSAVSHTAQQPTQANYAARSQDTRLEKVTTGTAHDGTEAAAKFRLTVMEVGRLTLAERPTNGITYPGTLLPEASPVRGLFTNNNPTLRALPSPVGLRGILGSRSKINFVAN